MKIIKNEDDYRKSQNRADELIRLISQSKEFYELKKLLEQMKLYELSQGEIPASTVEAIKNRIIERDIKLKGVALTLALDAASVSRRNTQRSLNYDIVKKLHSALDIPYEHLFDK